MKNKPQFVRSLMDTINKKDIQEIINFTRNIHKEADKFLSIIPNICKKGCSYCCSQLIRIHEYEEITIIIYMLQEINKSTKELIINNTSNWIDFFNNETPEIPTEKDLIDFEITLAKNMIPCPFLVDNCCSIYPVRPLTCRCFAFNDNSLICKNNPTRNAAKIYSKVRDEQMEKFFKKQRSALKILGRTVASFLLPKKEFKPIKYRTYG